MDGMLGRNGGSSCATTRWMITMQNIIQRYNTWELKKKGCLFFPNLILQRKVKTYTDRFKSLTKPLHYSSLLVWRRPHTASPLLEARKLNAYWKFTLTHFGIWRTRVTKELWLLFLLIKFVFCLQFNPSFSLGKALVHSIKNYLCLSQVTNLSVATGYHWRVPTEWPFLAVLFHSCTHPLFEKIPLARSCWYWCALVQSIRDLKNWIEMNASLENQPWINSRQLASRPAIGLALISGFCSVWGD